MRSVKVIVVSAAVVFTALGVKASAPFITTHLPLLWSFFLLCFKPPYLYVIVNAIIISIVASSRLLHSTAEANLHMEPAPPPVLEVKTVLVTGSPTVEEEEQQEEETEEEEKRVIVLKRIDSPEIPPEYPSLVQKPLVSARFGHRKPVKSSPEGGRALRVAKPKRHETLENTWKAITEGRSMPLSRHMKKCDTWQNRGDTGPLEATPTVKKCETFKDGTNKPKLRKEPSLSQDELNRRVEAFIRNFNEQMRLQRQESLNQYMQMVNRGTS